MTPYLDLLSRVIERGTWQPTRAVITSTGEKARALSVFGEQARYDLSDGFPLVTTKKMLFDIVVRELLWFLSGSGNRKDLERGGVRIWSKWGDADGYLGPAVYGVLWRGSQDFSYSDQIKNLEDGIKSVADCHDCSVARRLVLSSWHPAYSMDSDVPVGCHTLTQFAVRDGRLSCHLYQRSGDLFLGVPYNIASYALLTHLFAQTAGLGVGELIHSFGDAHIYENHMDQVKEQLTREPFPLSRLCLTDRDHIDDFGYDDIGLHGYQCHSILKGEVAI